MNHKSLLQSLEPAPAFTTAWRRPTYDRFDSEGSKPQVAQTKHLEIPPAREQSKESLQLSATRW